VICWHPVEWPINTTRVAPRSWGREGGVGIIVGGVWVELVIVKSGGLVVPPLADIVEAPNVACESACVRRGTVDAQRNTWEGGKNLDQGKSLCNWRDFFGQSVLELQINHLNLITIISLSHFQKLPRIPKKLLTTALRVGTVGRAPRCAFNPPILTHPPPPPPQTVDRCSRNSFSSSVSRAAPCVSGTSGGGLESQVRSRGARG